MTRLGSMASLIAVVLWLWAASATSASAEVAAGQLSVSVTPERLSTSVGTQTEVTVTIVNTSADPTPELAIHLDITDPRGSGSVDPEDWTAILTRAAPVVGPGEQVARTWTITPIQAGDFVLYAVVVDTDAGLQPAMPSVSNGVPVHVDEKRSFNPSGVLPLAIAMPVTIGAGLLWRHRRPLFR